jgi:predicted  nucleic acid-binding Zn-ribbon protein
MKNIWALFVLSIIAFAAGCTPATEKSAQADMNSTNIALAGHQVAEVKKEHDYSRKSEFLLEKETQLAAINRDLDALSTRMAALSATSPEAKSKLQSLREQAATLSKQIDEAKTASESTWDNVKTGSVKAYEGLQQSLEQARQWASDKLAP